MTGSQEAGSVADVVAMVLLVLGALLSLTAAVGLLRFPDVLSRLHAATKPQVLGTLLILVAVGLRVGISLDTGLLILTAMAQMITVPVAAHMVARAVHRTGQTKRAALALNDLEEPGADRAEGA